MHIAVSRTILCGLLCFFTLLSGVWLSHSGRPLNTAIFTIHKLSALATVITIILTVYKLRGTVDMQHVILVAIAVTGLLYLALFVSGALLSFDSIPQAALHVHQAVPLIALAASIVSIHLLVSSKA